MLELGPFLLHELHFFRTSGREGKGKYEAVPVAKENACSAVIVALAQTAGFSVFDRLQRGLAIAGLQFQEKSASGLDVALHLGLCH
jgi:hypothetical protein